VTGYGVLLIGDEVLSVWGDGTWWGISWSVERHVLVTFEGLTGGYFTRIYCAKQALI